MKMFLNFLLFQIIDNDFLKLTLALVFNNV